MKLSRVISVEIQGISDPLILNSQVVDVLTSCVQQVDFAAIGNDPDAHQISVLPSCALDEGVDAQCHTSVAYINLIEGQFHPAVHVRHLEALSSVRERIHCPRVTGDTGKVIGQTSRPGGVEIAGETHLSVGGCEIHICLTWIVDQCMVRTRISGVGVLTAR